MHMIPNVSLVQTWVQLSRTAGCTLYCSLWPARICVMCATALPVAHFGGAASATSATLLAAGAVPACGAVEMLPVAHVAAQLHARCVVIVTAPGEWDCTEHRPRVPAKVISSTPSPAVGSSSGAGMVAPTRVKVPAVWPNAAPAPVRDSSRAPADDAISIIAAPGNSARPCTCVAAIETWHSTLTLVKHCTC